MDFRKAWAEKSWPKLAAALGINLVFLVGVLVFTQPVFETNDDIQVMMAFDASVTEQLNHVMFLNVFLVELLRYIYIYIWIALYRYFPYFSFLCCI